MLAVLEGTSMSVIGPLLTGDEANSRQTKLILENSDSLLYVDGGHNWRPQFSQVTHVPCLSIGDGDSCDNQETLDLIFPTKKDRSDLGLALDHLAQQTKSITFLGFCSGRFDHELINLGVVNNYLMQNSHNVKATWYHHNKATRFSCTAGLHHFDFQDTFSLITLQEQNISISGAAKYCVHHTQLNVLSDRGLSNQASGPFSIMAQKPFILIRESL
jgi:thiamine pyrophosphokinase